MRSACQGEAPRKSVQDVTPERGERPCRPHQGMVSAQFSGEPPDIPQTSIQSKSMSGATPAYHGNDQHLGPTLSLLPSDPTLEEESGSTSQWARGRGQCAEAKRPSGAAPAPAFAPNERLRG